MELRVILQYVANGLTIFVFAFMVVVLRPPLRVVRRPTFNVFVMTVGGLNCAVGPLTWMPF